MVISSEDTTSSSKAEEILEIEHKGEELILGFNSLKLLEIIKTIDTQIIEILINSISRPVMIKPYESEESYQMLTVLMPIKV